MNKRGQMTLLIILGLVVVASVIGVYTFRESIFQTEWDKQRSLSLTVPAEAEELQAEITECIQEVIQDPVEVMGQQGGYIDIPIDPIGEGAHNELSNSLEIFPGTSFETAYWFYVAANGVESNQIPSIEEMELELGDYVNENLMDCFGDFELFLDNNATTGNVETVVEILDDEIQFTVYYPVHVDQEDFSFDFETFYESVDVPMGEMYKASLEILEEENTNYFLEELTYDMFVLYEELPMAWTELDCEQKTWDVEDIEQDFKEIVMENMLAVKIKGTQYDVNVESDEGYFEWDALDTDRDYRASVLYSSSWPILLDVYPEDDGVLTEDTYSAAGFAGYLQSIFCLTDYNFIYDIQYPVLVTLYDEDSDFTFQFASQVYLDNNQPRTLEEEVYEFNDEETICDNIVTPITVYAVGVNDDGSYYEMEDVDISFKCINSLCNIGTTEGRSGLAELETYVPQCLNAQIIGEKEGYNRGIEITSTLEEQSVTVVLQNFYELNYEIKIIDENGIVSSLDSEDTVLISLVDEETGYTAYASNPKNEDTIELVPGTYTVYGTLVSDAPFDIVIPASSYTKCESSPILGLGGIFGLESDTSCVDVDIDELELNSALEGGVDLTWKVSRSELSSASKLTLYVTSPGEPQEVEDVETIYNYLETQLGQMEPELS